METWTTLPLIFPLLTKEPSQSDFMCMQMDRTAFKQQSFHEAADHQSTYRNMTTQKQAESFRYLMSVAFSFVDKPWPKMEKQYFSSSKRA
jgi:hypothetical protein